MDYDVIIIGAGVTGCSAAYALSRYPLKTCVLEKEEDVCTGASKANSAIVHAGYDARPGSLMARYNLRGSERMESLCRELDVPYRRNGSLVLCFEEARRGDVEELLERGRKNGVRDLRIVEQAELRTLEPAVSPEGVCALFAPTGAIVDPFELTAALAEGAAMNGCGFAFNAPVLSAESVPGGWQVRTPDRTFTARCVVNAAGVYADTLSNSVSAERHEIRARRGEYCLLDKTAGGLVSHTLFTLPDEKGKGILVTPTVHGNLLTGPTADDVSEKDGTATTADGLARVAAAARRSVPGIPMNKVITSFAGLRAHDASREEKDFTVGFAPGAPGFYNLLGIESPGLTSAPALGEQAAQDVAAYLGAAPDPNFRPGRPPVVRPGEMSFEERQALCQRDGAYGAIVCRCEQVSEGEIRDAIRRSPGAKSLDGVKRRVRAGMGRCQAGFCSPRVMEILSGELGVPQTELTKNGRGRLLTGTLREE